MSLAALIPRGPVAADIDRLWRLMLWLGVATFVFVIALLAVGLFRRGDDSSGGGRAFLVGGGVVLPSVVIGAVFVATVVTMRGLAAPVQDPVIIEVTGHRWWWQVGYPGESVVTANEIVVPVGRPFEIRLSSADVIHSFWVPALGGKVDALPDGVNTLVLEASEAGVYRGACAEFCGLQHAEMGLILEAVPDGEFSRWLAHQRTVPQLPDAAFESFLAAGCGSCHTIRGTEAQGDSGPDLTHLASRRTIGAGVVPNTGDALARWVRDPHAVKQGVLMPAPELTPAELARLVDLLEELR